jgi:hypothetical protein
MTIKTSDVASLTLRQLISAMPVLTKWRNSKGRIMPLHLRSAPGQGKTVIAEQAAITMARQHPGAPVGVAVCTPSVMSPADAAGFVLFDSIKPSESEAPIKVSTYTRPTMFAVQRAFIYTQPTTDNPDGTIEEVTRDDFGQVLYVGSSVRGRPLNHGVMLLDEFDQADLEVRKALAPLLDEGRVTTHFLPHGWMVMAASNRARDASGTGRGLAFLTNRVVSLEVAPDLNALLAYLDGVSVFDTTLPIPVSMEPDLDDRGRVVRVKDNDDYNSHPVIASFVGSHSDKIFAGVPADPNEAFMTPRAVESVSNLFDVMLRLPVAGEDGKRPLSTSPRDTFVNRDASDDSAERWRVFTNLCAGVIGTDNARQLASMVDMYGEVPSIGDIIKAPKTANVPEKMDAQYLVANELAASMRRDNAEALLTYAKRLSNHFYELIIIRACSRDGELAHTSPTISRYIVDNPHAMVRMLTLNEQRKAQQGRGARR